MFFPDGIIIIVHNDVNVKAKSKYRSTSTAESCT